MMHNLLVTNTNPVEIWHRRSDGGWSVFDLSGRLQQRWTQSVSASIWMLSGPRIENPGFSLCPLRWLNDCVNSPSQANPPGSTPDSTAAQTRSRRHRTIRCSTSLPIRRETSMSTCRKLASRNRLPVARSTFMRAASLTSISSSKLASRLRRPSPLPVMPHPI